MVTYAYDGFVITAGVDVGGTNIEIGVIDADHEVLDRAKTPTPTGGPEAMVETIAELLESLDASPAAIGVGIPGGIHEGRIVHVPNLADWAGQVDFGPMLENRTGLPVALANDADIGLIGEWVAGVARSHDHVLGIWLGTGVGGALILNGQPYRGSLGAAGEVGHMIVRADGALCHCGQRGCIEAYAGRRSMADAVQRIADSGRPTRLFEIQREEGKSRPTSRVWQHALDDGDPVATETFSTAIETLGVGIGSIVNLLDPELVVIGGGMAEKLGSDLADRIRAEADRWMLHPNPDLQFRVASLGDDSGITGAAEIARAAVITT